MLITQQFNTAATQNLGRGAFRYLGRDTTYSELRTTVARLSYLYQNELGSGARVAFLARNCPAFATTFLALANTRSVTIPVQPDLSPDETMAWLKESKATHVAVTSDLVSTTRDLFNHFRTSLPIIEIEKKHGGEYDTSFTPPADNKPLETDPILLLRTAGVTGRPKFVPLTHKQLSHAAASLRGAYHFNPSDRIYTRLHWSNPFAFTHAVLLPLLLGGTSVIDHGLDIGVEHLDFLIDSRASRLVGVPMYFRKLLMVCTAEKRTIPGTKSVTVGLGSLSPEVRKAFGMLKVGVSHVYGQTENVWTLGIQDCEEPSDAPLRGLPGLKYRVIDENGDEIPGREKRVGQLAVMGPTVMEKGYLDRERETKTSIRGTWLYTGDVVQLDGDGETLRLQFLGRKEDLVPVTAGKRTEFLQLAPVDTVLRSISGVLEAAAFTQKNSKGERFVAAAIVKVQGSALTEKQILEACSKPLPPQLVPSIVAFTDSLPRDPGGGVHTARLRAQFSGIGG
jgi:acyl-CoA synthetase (AMP-forming)/AMP-acid ligase II